MAGTTCSRRTCRRCSGPSRRTGSWPQTASAATAGPWWRCSSARSMWSPAERAGLPALRERLRARFRRWLVRRIPPARAVTLDQRRIFIFPSRVGFFFFACLLVMLVAAINYENNMSYALTFLLATLFVVAVLHTYANLSGLTLQAGEGGSGFPGEVLAFPLRLHGGGQSRFAVAIRWRDASLGGAETRMDVGR